MPAFGWVGPANMPPDIIKRLTDELVAVGKIPEVRTALEKFGVLQTELPGPDTPMRSRRSVTATRGSSRRPASRRPERSGGKEMPPGILARLAVAAMALGLMAGAAAAQDKWPSRLVMVIVPFAAGGNTDVMARIFADHLTKRLGQQFVVENRSGAGGVTGLQAATRAAPDGYTIAVATSGPIAINPNADEGQDPLQVEKDFTHLYGMAAQPNVWLVHPSVPANTMAELIAWLKANPDTPYATSGPGTTQHLCGEMLAQAAGLKLTPVS